MFAIIFFYKQSKNNLKRMCQSGAEQCILSFIPSGNLLAASGPFVFFFFLPTLVGIGGSYFFFLSFCLHKLTRLRIKELHPTINN